LGFGGVCGFLGGGTQSVEAAVAGAGCASAGGGGAGAVSVLSSVAGGAFVAVGCSNEVAGVGPDLFFRLPQADNQAAATTHAKSLAVRI
jgi:hypothetical protein